MKKDKNWWIFIGVVIVIIIVLLIFKGNMKGKNQNSTDEPTTSNNQVENEFVKIEQDGTKVNTSNKLSEVKTIEGLEISNIRLTEKGNVTQILANIKNTTNKDVEGFYTSMTFTDKNGEIIVILGGYIPTVKANGTATLNTNSTGDFSNAYDFKVERSKQQ